MSKLASFAVGFGGGYLKAKDKEFERQRQEKLDKMAAEQHEWAKQNAAYQEEVRNRDRDTRRAIEDVEKAGTVEEEMTPIEEVETGFLAKPEAKPAAAAPVAAPPTSAPPAGAVPSPVADTPSEALKLPDAPPPAANAAPAPTDAAATPADTKRYSVRALDGTRKYFTGLDAAKQYAEANMPSGYSKYRALAERLETKSPELAKFYLDRAKMVNREGLDRTLALLDAGKADEARKVFNASGDIRLQEGQSFATNTVDGRKVHQVVDAEGNVVIPDVEGYAINYIAGIDGRAAKAAARDKLVADRSTKLWEWQNDPKSRFMKANVSDTVWDLSTGKIVQKGVNKYTGEPVLDAEGNVIGYTGGGAGGAGGAKKGPKSPEDIAAGAVMDAVKAAGSDNSIPSDVIVGAQAVARELVFNASRSGKQIDPFVAGQIALKAATNPDSVKPSYNHQTGQLEATVTLNGNTFAVGLTDPTTIPPEQRKGIAQGFVQKLSKDSLTDYVKAATGDKATIEKLNGEISAAFGKEWVAAFKSKYKRDPSPDEIKANVANAQEVLSRHIEMVRESGAVEQWQKAERRAAGKPAAAAPEQPLPKLPSPAEIMAWPKGKAGPLYAQYAASVSGRTAVTPELEALRRKAAQDAMTTSAPGLR